ncbi:sensor histidine kinase [Brachybacterium sp. YJGR34]|uniref:sensor histidine kinase n=1 Tax=Brachybacterium sp. YJGR34 TaxID=2059911 RepID=UPI000E0C669A|nr:histidine kinase [Brachybacterium sp. YJGR34]
MDHTGEREEPRRSRGRRSPRGAARAVPPRLGELATRRTAPPAVLMVLAIIQFSVLVPIHVAQYGTPVALAIPLGAVLCIAPVVALTRPGTATVLFCAAVLVLPLAGLAGREAGWPWPWSVPAMIAFTLFVLVITIVHGWRAGLVPWAVSLLGTLLMPMIGGPGAGGTTGAGLIVTASISGAALLVAVLIAGRLRVGAELSRERELTAAEHARRILVEERTRIARELHDVVAHSTSLIQVQASTARYRIPDLPPSALAEFEEISRNARGSLTEMRRLLGVLRTEDDDAELAPQQSIADIPALVEGIRQAGGAVELTYSPPPDGLAPSVHIAAFRITQEALSNAVRHAPGAPITLAVEPGEDAVRIVVHNGPSAADPPPAALPAAAPGGGHGLRGMQERVTLLGGSLVVGPDPSGGWTVTAVLPWRETGTGSA